MACDKARGAVLSPLFPTEDSPVAIHFACPECKTPYTVNDRDAGKKSDCKQCGQRLEVPKPPERLRTVLGETLPTDEDEHDRTPLDVIPDREPAREDHDRAGPTPEPEPADDR